MFFFFFSSRRRHTRWNCDWSSDVCSSDLAVYINTAQEFDGSDAGARPDEAISWGKIKVGADSVKVRECSKRSFTNVYYDSNDSKVYVEATACFPLIVAAT